MPLRYNVSSSTGTANALTAGSVVGGTALVMGDNARQKIRNLSALVTCLAETNTFTWSFKFQVSNDNSTWVDVANGTQNAAAVVIGTGTAGADTAVTKAFSAPEAVAGWRYCRAALVTGVATGASADTYTISYCYRAG